MEDMHSVVADLEGAKQAPRVLLRKLILTNGVAVDLQPDDVLIVVGPNNSGKSALLRGIRQKVESHEASNSVLKAIELDFIGTTADLQSWLEELSEDRAAPPGVLDPVYHLPAVSVVYRSQAQHWWNDKKGIAQLTPLFCLYLMAEGRIGLGNPAQSVNLTQQAPSHPIHYLQRDDNLELSVSRKFRRAFGHDLVVHRNAGSVVPLYVGTRPTHTAEEDRASLGYARKLQELAPLDAQGDGMRSFAGIILATSVGAESIVLIDEPEAFLHPPQARLLGATVLEGTEKRGQVLLATHSSDILKGALDAAGTRLKVLRMRRSGAGGTAQLLDNQSVKDLWADPLLRYSNAFEGLFHDGIVVCESDADCRFYSAIVDTLQPASVAELEKSPDLLFTHCGGKARLAVISRAMVKLGVPVRVIADFDILSDEKLLQSIVESLGGEWAALRPNWNIVNAAVTSKKAERNLDEVKSQIDDVFASVSGKTVTKAAARSIKELLNEGSPWSLAKQGGTAFIPNGAQSLACNELINALKQVGLFVVPVGELEGFCREEPDHGPKWVNNVLQRPLATDPELQRAREFMRGMLSTISSE